MKHMAPPSGHYPIERRAGEVERLRLQNAAWAEDTAALLDAVGVGQGWHCLDLGCGPGGITDVLAEKVGPGGRVFGLDADAEFIEIARGWGPKAVEYRVDDAYATGLPGGAFDLVHIRFLASTAGEPDRLIAEALRLLRPGGVLAMQEADFPTLRCFPPHPAWDELVGAFRACFPGHDGEESVAQSLYRRMRAAGCQDLGYRPRILGVRAGDAWQDYLPATMESLRTTVTERKLIPAERFDVALAECRAHLAEPGTIFTSFTCVQAWGRKPKAG